LSSFEKHIFRWVVRTVFSGLKKSMRTLGDKITDDYKSLRLGSSAKHLTLYTDYRVHCYRCKCRQITHQQALKSCHNMETLIKIQSKNNIKGHNYNFLGKINISSHSFSWP
jgi:hypothetical protein